MKVTHMVLITYHLYDCRRLFIINRIKILVMTSHGNYYFQPSLRCTLNHLKEGSLTQAAKSPFLHMKKSIGIFYILLFADDLRLKEMMQWLTKADVQKKVIL